MTESDHARLLLAILGQRWTEVDRRTANAAVDPGVFLDLCRQGDVPTLVHVALVKSGRLELIGSGALEELVRIRNRTRRDNLLLIARAEQALDVLLRAGVVPIALKGLELLHRHYDSFDERILDDVDLLVRPEQLTTAIEALQTEGFELPGEPARTHYIRSSHHLPWILCGRITY